MQKKLTPEIERAILGAAGRLTTASAIAASVNADLGTSLSRRTVATVLQRTRTERADIAKAVVREELTKAVLSDIERLEQIRRQVARKARRVGDAPELLRAWAQLKELELRVLDRKLHYAGADSPDDANAELSEAGERLRSRLDRLASGSGAGCDPARSGADAAG